MYVGMYVCLYIYIYVCVLVCMCVCVYACVYVQYYNWIAEVSKLLGGCFHWMVFDIFGRYLDGVLTYAWRMLMVLGM